jgi:hypothetical protein
MFRNLASGIDLVPNTSQRKESADCPFELFWVWWDKCISGFESRLIHEKAFGCPSGDSSYSLEPFCLRARGAFGSLRGRLSSSKIVEISKGTGLKRYWGRSLRKGASYLVSLGFLRRRFLATGQRGKLQAGEYEFPKGISLKEALQKLVLGQTYQRKITIPEGLTSFEIVALLSGL